MMSIDPKKMTLREHERGRRARLTPLRVRDLIGLLEKENPDAHVAVRSDPPVGQEAPLYGAAVETQLMEFEGHEGKYVVIFGDQSRL